MIKFKEILFLNNISGIGKGKIYKNYWNILEDAKNLDDLFSKMQNKSNVTDKVLKMAREDAEKLYESILNSDIHVITVFDKEEYPKKLMDMGNERPLILYVKGNVDALKKPNIAVIGTRNPTNSQLYEKNLVKGIIQNSDRVVVSGLAWGCDTIAHQTTVDENKVTIAVLPSGVNVVKPAKNKKLAQEIINSGGCLVSEYLPDVKPNKGSYVQRDKIVAAFSDATFVVECGVKSGTMHTVRFANDYKRQIYSYLPSERPEGSYDGNEFILKEFEESIEVEDIEDFINDLNTLTIEKNPKSAQTTLFNF